MVLYLGEILLGSLHGDDGRAIDLLALELVGSGTRVTIEVAEPSILGAEVLHFQRPTVRGEPGRA
jgi:hypothetical protein